MKHQSTLFSAINVAFAPDSAGVYWLWQNGELVYIGKSDDSIRDRLKCHLSGREGDTYKATHYSCELTMFPSMREAQEIAAFKQIHGCTPRYNEVQPTLTGALADLMRDKRW